MELGVRVRVEASPERDGAVVIPGRLLLDVIRALPKDEVSIEHRTTEQDVDRATHHVAGAVRRTA